MPKWLEENAPENDVVVSTRIRLARNLADVPFPSRITRSEDVESVHALAKESLLKSPEFRYSRLADMTELSKRALIERNIISSDLARNNLGGLIANGDESVSVMIMEEDHYRLQSLKSGLALKRHTVKPTSWTTCWRKASITRMTRTSGF